jgi:hypothetical protein
MEKLDKEAGVLDTEGAHTQAALIFGAADPVPSDEAFCAGGAFPGVPKEGSAQGVERLDHGRRQH